MKYFLSAILALCPILHAQILGGFESFTRQANAESWGYYDYGSGEAFIAPWQLPESDDFEIYATFTEEIVFNEETQQEEVIGAGASLFADAISSDGYFVGDYDSAGIDSVFCDAYIEDLATFGDVEFYILAGGIFYYSNFYVIESSGWVGLDASFSNDQWYIYDEDDQEFVAVELTPLILSDVAEIGLNFYPASVAGVGKAVAIDNFTLLPNLDPAPLTITSNANSAEISFTGIEGLQYTIQASPSLEENTWTNVGSPFEITGPSQTTLPVATRSFFRLLALPFYIETP